MHSSRTHLCIFCALMAALIGLMLALGPLHVLADDAPPAKPRPMKDGKVLPNSVAFAAEGEATPRRIQGAVSMLGGGDLLGGFRMLALAKFDDNTNQTQDFASDDKGRYWIVLGKRVKELRVYAYGDYVIPDSWSTVPLPSMKFEKDETWDLKVRPNAPVEIKGRVTIKGRGTPAELGNVYLAPLDVRQDGTMQVFDAPLQTRCDNDGRYSFRVPAGYYRLWAVWADRSVREWPHYIGLDRRVELFASMERNLEVSLGPVIQGRVTDARDGKGLPGRIDLYTNAFLRQLNNTTSDGEMPDEEDENGKDITWPAGTFKFRVFNVDTEDFAAVIRPRGNNASLRVISGLNMADLESRPLDWKLYTEDQIVVDLRAQTRDRALPIFQLDLSLEATRLDDKSLANLRSAFTVSGYTDDNGLVRFTGLAPGRYNVYAEQQSLLLAEITVTAERRQRIALDYDIPVAVGTLKYEDGTPCTEARALVTIEVPERGKMGPFFRNPFESKSLREKGLGLLPLTFKGATFKITFLANDPGKPIPEEWLTADFPWRSEEWSVTVTEEKAYDFKLTLKPGAAKEPEAAGGPARAGEHWYRMEDSQGAAMGYARLVVENSEQRQKFDWEMKLAFSGGTYEEQRLLEVDSARRLLRAAYSADGKSVSEAARKDGRLVGTARKGDEMLPIDLPLTESHCTLMDFLLAATLPLKEGASLKVLELDEANGFADNGETTLTCRGKDAIDWEGKSLSCWKFELSNNKVNTRRMTIWVSAAREVIKVDWGGGIFQVLSPKSTKDLYKPK